MSTEQAPAAVPPEPADQPAADQPAADQPGPEKPGLMSGRMLLLLLTGLALLTPVAVWGTLKWVESQEQTLEPLVWADRYEPGWQAMPVNATQITKPAMKAPFESSPIKDAIFDLSPDQRLAVKALSAAVAEAGQDGFAADAMRDRLEAEVAAHPEQFYPRYLLGLWHAGRGDTAAAEPHIARAVADAPVVLVMRYVEVVDGEPRFAEGLEVGRVAVDNERIEDRAIADRVTLEYRGLVADEMGQVFVPVFATVWRFSHLPQPPGYATEYPVELKTGWFELPRLVQAGMIPPARLYRRGDANAPASD